MLQDFLVVVVLLLGSFDGFGTSQKLFPEACGSRKASKVRKSRGKVSSGRLKWVIE